MARGLGRYVGVEGVEALEQRVEDADGEIVEQLRIDALLSGDAIILRHAEREVRKGGALADPLLDPRFEIGLGNVGNPGVPQIDLYRLERLLTALRRGLCRRIARSTEAQGETPHQGRILFASLVARKVVDRQVEKSRETGEEENEGLLEDERGGR